MNKVSKLKRYTDMFRRHLSGYLAPGINIGTVIYPVEQEGAVFEFHLQKNLDMSERVERTNPSIASVLKRIPQNFIGGTIEGVRFGGTNIGLDGNRILIIKGEDSPTEWNDSAVIKDVKRVVSTSLGSRNE